MNYVGGLILLLMSNIRYIRFIILRLINKLVGLKYKMFYFLIFHTSISASKTIDNKLLTTFLYGSVLYLILHGLIKTSKYAIFKHLAEYYWYCIIIDVATLIYLTWGIIDYQGMISRFIDTSAYSGLENNIEDEPIISRKITINNISDYVNEVKTGKQVNINEDINKVHNFNGNESIIKKPKITTAREMGLQQSTSLDELGLNDVDNVLVSNEPVETGVALPEGTEDFFADTIDVSDRVSNISDVDLDEFESGLE
jgi:hypothetical protein